MTTAAIVGCGDISIMHAEAIAKVPGASLVAVSDTDSVRVQEASRRSGAPAFHDHRDMLDAVRPDVVHVCTPHDQHVAVALDALAAGSDVLLEKPVAHTLTEADRLVEASVLHPYRKIGVCLQNRYNAPVLAARRMLEGRRILGASATVLWHRDAAYYAARPWRGQKARSGGGVLINQALHTVDLLQWLLGDVTRVRGSAGRHLLDGIDVEDTASLFLEHAGGVRSILFATVANAVDAPVTIEITASGMTLLLRDGLTVTHADGRVETSSGSQEPTKGRSYWGASHELLIADFYKTTGPFWIDAAEGRKSLAIVKELT
jgi:UDP-N-acetyl-2-amino-2-deoxyglucuronate dehydrogenase